MTVSWLSFLLEQSLRGLLIFVVLFLADSTTIFIINKDFLPFVSGIFKP